MRIPRTLAALTLGATLALTTPAIAGAQAPDPLQASQPSANPTMATWHVAGHYRSAASATPGAKDLCEAAGIASGHPYKCEWVSHADWIVVTIYRLSLYY